MKNTFPDYSVSAGIPSEYLDWRLCYVRDPFLYFCRPEDYEVARGDDWDDAPYQYNAGPPNNVQCYVIAVYPVYYPIYHFSVDGIRAGNGWFLEYGYGDPHERIHAGLSLREVIEIAKGNDLEVYVPLRWEYPHG